MSVLHSLHLIFSNIIELTALTILDESWTRAGWWHHCFLQSWFIAEL